MDERISKLLAAAGVGGTSWSSQTTSALASIEVPEQVFGHRRELLNADARFVWARWYLASLVDADRILTAKGANYGDVYRAVVAGLRATTNLDPLELKELAKILSKEASDSVERQKRDRERIADADLREQLVRCAGAEPRCWVCGHRFEKVAIERFLRIPTDSPSDNVVLPCYVDRFKPIGTAAAHFAVHVDHVHPYSRGGADAIENLRLCCGWCNVTKSNKLGLYDGSLRSRTVVGERGKRLSAPQPFWTVRILALRGQCEHPGCGAKTADAELSVGLRHDEGAAVPQNLMVLCDVHNQRPERFVTRSAMVQAKDAPDV